MAVAVSVGWWVRVTLRRRESPQDTVYGDVADVEEPVEKAELIIVLLPSTDTARGDNATSRAVKQAIKKGLLMYNPLLR